MLQEAQQAGLSLHDQKLKAVLGGEIGATFELAAVGGDVDCEAIRSLNSATVRDHRLHKSLRWAWWLLELFPHKYFDQTGAAKLRLAPWPHWRELPNGALLHPTLLEWLAGERSGKKPYQPANIRRGRVTRYVANTGDKLSPEVRERLVAKGYGSYRAVSGTGLPGGPKVLYGIVALNGISMALLLRQRTLPSSRIVAIPGSRAAAQR